METIILDIDLDFENADTLYSNSTQQNVMTTLSKYHDALSKALSVIDILRDNIAEDETDDLELFVDDDDKLCVRTTSELAERFVCFGIADYDEYACDSDDNEDDDDNFDSESNESSESNYRKDDGIEVDLDALSDSDSTN